MKQLVSLVKDGQVHYALVDDDEGQLIPFADILIPDPDRFGLHESALLGTNLIQALGLNGHKRPKAAEVRVGTEPPTHISHGSESATATNPVALPPAPAAPQYETAAERKRRLGRESYYRKQAANGHAVKPRIEPAGPLPAPTKERGRPLGGGRPNPVPLDEMLDVLARFPAGIGTQDLARVMQGLGSNERPDPRYVKAISNRVTHERANQTRYPDWTPHFIIEHTSYGKESRLLLKPNPDYTT